MDRVLTDARSAGIMTGEDRGEEGENLMDVSKSEGYANALEQNLKPLREQRLADLAAFNAIHEEMVAAAEAMKLATRKLTELRQRRDKMADDLEDLSKTIAKLENAVEELRE